MTKTDSLDLIDRPYPLTQDHIERFRADGFIKLRDVFDESVLARFIEPITSLTVERNPDKDVPIDDLDIYSKAFIQVMNLWRMSEQVRSLSFSKRLAGIATGLLGTRGVRMYHDQALYKVGGGGFTPWHADQQYWPLETALCVTAWTPLQAVPMEMGPLCFAQGSHLKNIGRDLEISDESQRVIEDQLKRFKLIEIQEPFETGEVSFHLGWTLHRAGPNTTDQPRKVHTVIYIDRDMRLAEPKNANQQRDWENWSPSTKFGQIMDDQLNPVLFSLDD